MVAMGVTDQEQELIQLGPWEVAAEGLTGGGMRWEEILEHRMPSDLTVLTRAPADFPTQGWRVLDVSAAEWSPEVLIIGAPSSTDAERWVVAQLAHRDSDWLLTLPITCAALPSRGVRGKSLKLEWAQNKFLVQDGFSAEAAVVLRNDSDSTWVPTEEDQSHVQTVIVDSHGNTVGGGWCSFGTSLQLPDLGPSETVTLPTLDNNPELPTLPSGAYKIFAFLPSLNLRTTSDADLIVV